MALTRPKASQINFDLTNISDPIIRLNSEKSGANDTDVGFIFERGSTGDNAVLIWDESADQFVLGTTTATGVTQGDLTVTASALSIGSLTVDTNTLYVDSSNNRVGIGTTSPAYQVEIENTGANALLVLDRTDGAACFIEGQATRSAFGSVGATPLALAYNSLAVVTIGENGAITVNPDGDGFTFPTTDGSANQILQTNGSGVLSFTGSPTFSGATFTGAVSGTDLTLTGDLSLNDADDQIIHGDTNYNQKQYVLYGSTSDATETEIFVGGTTNSRIPVASNTTVFYEVNIVARRTDATGESGGWHLKAVVDNFSGTVADVGSVYEVQVASDDANYAVDARADNTNDSIGIYVTGVAGKTISWTAIVKTFEVAQ